MKANILDDLVFAGESDDGLTGFRSFALKAIIKPLKEVEVRLLYLLEETYASKA